VLLIVILGSSIFAVFEVETALWRKLLKWLIVAGGTVGLYYGVGHWALALPFGLAALGGGVSLRLVPPARHSPVQRHAAREVLRAAGLDLAAVTRATNGPSAPTRRLGLNPALPTR